MPPPTVRINTFVKDNEELHVDPISKVYIVLEVLFGLDRLPLLGRGKFIYVFLTFMYFLIIDLTIVYLTVQAYQFLPINTMMVTHIFQNVICVLLSFTRCKWMLNFYSELYKFDTEAGCRPKVSVTSITNFVVAILSCVFIIIVLYVSSAIGFWQNIPHQLVPLHLVYILEVYYFGHLLNLLTPRLKLINHHIESKLNQPNTQNAILKEFVFFKSSDSKRGQNCMRKVMNLYLIMVEAYDSLIEGIKWQLLVVLISAFISIMGFLYMFSLRAIQTGEILFRGSLIHLGVTVITMTPLFSPCIFGDFVHSEVKKMRELLASRLYENKLDKTGRSAARALLAFTETRALSFRLLRMVNIDISLPFKFVGLLVTYLIILLQFEKVINP